MPLIAWLVVLVAIMAGVGTLITRTTVSLMGRFGGEAIGRTHADLEYALEHRSPPPGWIAAARKRRGKSGPYYRKRLNALIRHCERTSLVADEETRDLLLERLGKIREEWADPAWERSL